jgi:hypothetical protein
MTSAVGYFSSAYVHFETSVRAALEERLFPSHFVAARISYESLPYHRAPESDSYSCFTEIEANSVLMKVSQTTAVADVVFRQFQSMLQESTAGWEGDMQTHGNTDFIELELNIEVLSSTEPVSQTDYHAILGVSPDMQICIDQVNQLIETGDFSIGNILAFVPKLGSLSEEEIGSMFQSEDPSIPIREFLGIPNLGNVSEDDDCKFDKLRASSSVISNVFYLNLSFVLPT